MLLEDPVTGIELTAVLPSLRSERGRRYHDLLLQWKPHFSRIDIPVNIVTEDAGDVRLQDPEILYIQDSAIIRQLNAWQTKSVFGSEVETVRASLFLIRNEEILGETRRLSDKALARIWKQGFDLQMDAVRQELESRF